MDSAGAVAQTIDNEWQPRLGFALQPGRIGTQRIYGSAARYYQELSTWSITMTRPDQGEYKACAWDHDPRLDPSGERLRCLSGSASTETPELRGQYSDEYSLGYELLIGGRTRAGARAIYRTLSDTVEDAWGSAAGAAGIRVATGRAGALFY